MPPDLETRLAAIEARNRKVEEDKAWETSGVRKGLIIGITYVCACLLLAGLGQKDFYLGALVPCAGYFLSTLTLPLAKAQWLKRRP